MAIPTTAAAPGSPPRSADGRPLKIHRSRIRTTHEAMRDKSAWTGSGRATIDPNHTRRPRVTTT